MELRVWKTLLLQWVQKCNFIENISCLEDSDIEAFFANMQYAGVELATKQPESPLNITPFLGSLKTFLQDNYPDFEPHFEHDGRIANEDYIYVYTLLMHYTCIQSPITYFHNICNDLPKTMQQCIVVFFEQIVNDPELTRNRLRRIIRNIREDAEINTNSSVSALASSTTDSTPIDNDAIGCANPVTPSPVQKKLHSLCDSSQMPVPSTPRTELLEQRTRELLGLRAELATERYEKTFLEEQIIEDEKLINSLSERNKQLAQMKAVLQKENDEENCANSIVTNEVDNLKRQLQKELSNKDDIIAERDEQMLELKAKHDKVSAKLKLSEKQLRVCIEKINVLELHSESFAPMLTIKEETIACLQRDKLELEQCLKETRDELHKGREVLNASSDLLDTSQSASSMNTTPETLACSVIDKQLREKEQENEELREQLTSIRVATACIVDGILKIAQQHQVEIPTKPNDDVQLLNLIRRSMEKLSSSFVQEEQRVKELQDQFNIQIQQCAHHEENIQHLKNNAEKLAKELEDSQSNLKTSNEKLQNNEIEITKKDKELLQLSEELIKFGNQERTLQDRIATESELSLKQCQMLSEQEKIIQTQELKLAEQQAKLTDAQNQLKRFLDRVSAQVNTKIASMSSGENGLKEVENVLMRMCNQLEESKVEMAAKCEQLTAQDHFLMQMLKTLNAHIEQPIGPNNIVTLPKNLQFLNMKLALFVSKYEHLHAKCNSLESDNLQTVENMRQLVSELEENTIIRKQLEKQCDELMQQMQQKSEECEKITQQLQSEKANKTTIQSELGKELQTLKLTCQDLKMTKEQQLLDRESLQKGLQKQCDELMQQLQQKSEECEKITQQLQSEKANKTTIQSELGKELQTLKLTCQDLKMTKEQQLLDRESLQKGLQKQCDELMQQLQQKSEECEKITQQLQSEKANKTTIQSELGKELQTLKLTCQDLKMTKEQQLLDRESLQKGLQKQCDELMQQLQQKSEECEKITQQLQSEKANKTTIQSELGKELQTLKLTCQDLKMTKEQQLLDRESLRRGLQKKCDELMQQLQQKSEECEKITQQLQSEKANKTTIQSELGKELQTLKMTCQDLEMTKEQQLLDRESLRRRLQKKCDELMQQLQQKSEECEKITQQLQSSKASKTTIEGELGMALQKLELAEKTKEQQLHDRESLIEDLQKKCDELMQQLQQKSEECEKVTQQLQSEKASKTTIEGELGMALQKLELAEKTKEQRLHDRESLIEDLQKKCDELMQQLQQKSDECEKITQALQVEKASKTTIQSELGMELQKLESACQALEMIKEQQSHERESLVLDIQKLHDELKVKKLKILTVEEEQNRQLVQKNTVEKELETVKATLAQRELQLEQSKTQLDTYTKRLERTVIKLGEQQAVVSKTQRELVQIKFAQEEQAKLLNAMQHEKEGLQLELRTSKERANRSEEKLSSLEQQYMKIQSLEQQQERKIKLEKVRDIADKKMILVTEEENTRLRLQIGALNSDIVQQQKRIGDLTDELQLANDTIAKVRQELEANKALQCDLDDKLKHLKSECEKANERESHYQRKLKALKDELEESLADNIDIRNSKETMLDTLHKENRMVLDQMNKQKAKEHQMELDCQILQAKYRDAKEEIGRCEQKLKDQRLEMEGKLEKMKSKMDGPHGLDDSMSALLSTTGGNCTGTRKKSMGTHYKRPGPPTPSKNGGRLSFGSSEPAREILRETYDNNGSTKTPARFKIFASRFSMGSSGATGGGGQCLPRDEQRHSHRKKKVLPLNQRRNPRLREEGVFCTSTPRTSRSYFDNLRRNLLSDAAIVAQQEVQEGTTPHLSNAMPLIMNNPQVRRLTLCRRPPVSSASSTASGVSSHNRRKRKSTARKSVCPHGNIFVMDRRRGVLPATGSQQRLQQRTKGKQNRIQCFDQARHMGDNSSEIESESEQKTNDNNNYSSHNRNKATYSNLTELEESQQPQMALDVTQEGNNYIQQLHQQFEADHVCAWLNGAANVSAANATEHSHDFHFDQLCLQTESTAPFELQPLQYDELPSNTEQQNDVGAIVLPTNITAISTSNVSYTTNVSSCQSWTTLSSVAVRSHALPEVTLMPCKHSSTAPEWRVVYQPHANILSQLGHCIGIRKCLVLVVFILLILMFPSKMSISAAIGILLVYLIVERFYR
ncbi:sporulation-specific protein 15 isoform X3 [Drosophila grimshawi]|uniref:sporulation-specific protein 15 isoform X3 n=1 Tax=Drosophila grimshawi TaxID=7222 RepID=UPI001C934352|nr:sporulation-specific protein 15 isoform X3 [Drosophila grimshawi]